MKETNHLASQVLKDLGSDTERLETLSSIAVGNETQQGVEAASTAIITPDNADSTSKQKESGMLVRLFNEINSLTENSEKENGESVDENGNVQKLTDEAGKEESASELPEESSSTTSNTTTTTNTNTTNTTRVRRRKQEHPFKSPEKNDPNFRGVHFYMQNHLTKDRTGIEFCIGGRFDCRRPGKRRQSEVIGAKCLIVGSYEYLERKRKSRRLNRKSFVKECASCRSRKTPLWRDVESVPLCNACGIRFKKYKLRCENCWSVPRKEKSRFPCEQCGGSIQDYN
ncbi:DgyrCDS8266 [Dimorphilus gyrociliatus]|uniref:DgyrCDS8266 n=1 Tax=Dimorphilus gyrociliatus TaxID=2664684 RepID=A0A7I8VUM6_9ANNE|nr:DgyrCDS8266 [Dimorphilus gyrociliatus]